MSAKKSSSKDKIKDNSADDPLDYVKLGLKCGIEIHQQLDTHKLFCFCPSLIRDDQPDVFATRQLRAVVGETGEIDDAAAYEATRAKKIVYQGYSDSTCPIEFDEEPPRQMNQDALKTTLQVSKLLDARIVDEIQVMRKTVVDGSNTAGFQRTGLVGRHGNIKSEDGTHIGIPTIIVEEDAAKIVEQTSEQSTYNLSRLGIPLIEIGTDPDIKTPEQAKEVALKLGLILRSTGKVKRGLGTIRQDLNVSITKGCRVEIKGAQDLKMIPDWIKNEIRRQMNLSEIKDDIHERKISISNKRTDITDVFEKTGCKVIKNALKKKGVVKAIRLTNSEGILGKEIQPGKRFGTELSDYAKSGSSVKGLFHSDEDLEKYSLSKDEIKKIRERLKCKDGDSFILIADMDQEVEKAFDAVLKRLDVASMNIPKEVRRANPDGTSTFMRPMPGAARMYPETDCLPIPTKGLVKDIEIPELIEEKQKRFEKEYGLSSDQARQLSRLDYSVFAEDVGFDDLVENYKNVKPGFIAQSILDSPKELKKRFNIEIDDSIYTHILFLLKKLDDSEITRGAFVDILAEMVKGKKVDFSKYRPISKKEVQDEVEQIVKKDKDAPFGALMGKAMAKFKGKVDGKLVSELIKKALKK